MPVNVTSAEQVRGTGRDRHVVNQSSGNGGTLPDNHIRGKGKGRDATQQQQKNNKQYPAYKCRATQTTPRFDLVTDVMAIDIEGCGHSDGVNHIPYIGSLALANTSSEGVIDTFCDHGFIRDENNESVQFINQLPPAWRRLGVVWKDLYRSNGARPIKEVMSNFIKIARGKTLVFHAAKGDRERLDNSAAFCELVIPWEEITVRDTQTYDGYQNAYPGVRPPGPALKKLAAIYFKDMDLQSADHSALQDAIATMQLYLRERVGIEKSYASGAPSYDRDPRESSESASLAPSTPPTEVSNCKSSDSASQSLDKESLAVAISRGVPAAIRRGILRASARSTSSAIQPALPLAPKFWAKLMVDVMLKKQRDAKKE